MSPRAAVAGLIPTALSMILCILVVSSDATAASQPLSPLTVTSSGVGTACFDSATLRTQLAAQLGHDPFSGSAPPRVVVQVRRDERWLEADVTIFDASGFLSGDRRLRAANCADLTASLGLVLRLALDTRRQPPSLVRQTPPDSPPPFRLWIGLGASTGIPAEPAFAIMTTLGAEGRWQRFSLGLEGSVAAPVARATAQGGSFSEQLFLAALVPCYRWSVFGACAVVTGGVARVSGFDYPAAQTSVTPYVALGARALADLPLSDRLALRFQVALLAPVAKPSINLEPSTVLWTHSAVNGELGIAFLARLN